VKNFFPILFLVCFLLGSIEGWCNVAPREGKEYISDFNWDKYDFTGRTFDSWTLRALQVDPMANKYYSTSPYVLWINNPLRVIDPTGMWIVGTDCKPITYDVKTGWSANTSNDVLIIGNAMMITSEGKNVLNNTLSSDYVITLNYKEGFHPEKRNKLGETIINYDKNSIINVEINLYDGKIKENQVSKSGYTIRNPTEKQQLLIEQVPTLTERIGQVGAHEGTHATDKNAMPFMLGGNKEKAEIPANESEIKAIKQTNELNRLISIDIEKLKIP
jgi:hypothetical protein